MQDKKITIKKPQITKIYQKVPSFSHSRLTPDMFGINALKDKTTKSKFCIIGTGIPLHEYLNVTDYEIFDEESSEKEEIHDHHGCSTLISGLLTLNTNELKGLCPNSEMYYAKAFNNKGMANYNALSASVLWGIIKKVNTIIIPCEIKDRYDGLYSILQKANEMNISIIAPLSVNNGVKYDEILYVGNGKTSVKKSVNMNEKNKIYTTYIDSTYAKISGIYEKLSITAGLLENIKSSGIKTNKNAYESMLSYFP